MFNPVSKNFEFGGQKVTLETGKVARQATGAVIVSMGAAQVLATVVGRKQANPGQDFFSAHGKLSGKDLCSGENSRRFF